MLHDELYPVLNIGLRRALQEAKRQETIGAETKRSWMDFMFYTEKTISSGTRLPLNTHRILI
jgi:hypothetical protein